MRSTVVLGVLLFGGIALHVAHGDTIDFEDQTPGEILSEIVLDEGTIGVEAFNPSFAPNTNAAVVFDSSDPTGGDVDLGTPNEMFFGPGVGEAGEITNDTALGNVLIIAEDLVDASPDDGLVDDPDDADLKDAWICFDFSTAGKRKKNTVTINSVTILDVEAEQGEGGTFVELSGPNLPVNLIAIPPSGDNGVIKITGINLSGVSKMRVNFNGSGAVASVDYNEDNPESECWFTFGGFDNGGITSGGKDFTFGGNVGPPPSGSIQVNDHNTGDKFHSNDVSIVECTEINKTGPGQPGGKKGLVTNKATFEGTGKFNGIAGYPFTGFVIDAGEPAGKKSNDKDHFEITVRDPDTNAIVFEAGGDMDGGNVQIHPAK